MTVGASGALNDILRALVNPGDELLTPAPYFLGYDNYAFLVDADLVTAPTDARFHLDLAAIAAAITSKTRVVLINSPNNPTGAVYSAEEINGLAKVLENASTRFGKRIYLVSDEPYRRITYGAAVPSVFAAYPHSVVVNSFSKELSLAGERIGYLAVHPRPMTPGDPGRGPGRQLHARRQRAQPVPAGGGPRIGARGGCLLLPPPSRPDLRHREGAGYEFTRPEGAFYLFPKSPIPDDARFTEILKDRTHPRQPRPRFRHPGLFPDLLRRAGRHSSVPRRGSDGRSTR